MKYLIRFAATGAVLTAALLGSSGVANAATSRGSCLDTIPPAVKANCATCVSGYNTSWGDGACLDVGDTPHNVLVHSFLVFDSVHSDGQPPGCIFPGFAEIAAIRSDCAQRGYTCVVQAQLTPPGCACGGKDAPPNNPQGLYAWNGGITYTCGRLTR